MPETTQHDQATAVIPVKRFGAAKSRLGEALGREERRTLAAAMLEDVLAALAGARMLERLIVVTGERRAERIALERAKRATTPIEVLRDPGNQGHNPAATLGVLRARALGARCVALLPGDCPLLDAGELDAALSRFEAGGVAIVPDRHGSGTNGLVLAPPDAIRPAFGEGSRERHGRLARAAGVRATIEPIPSLALDVDTPDDLAAIRAALEAAPATAPRTAEALRELAAEPGGASRPVRA